MVFHYLPGCTNKSTGLGSLAEARLPCNHWGSLLTKNSQSLRFEREDAGNATECQKQRICLFKVRTSARLACWRLPCPPQTDLNSLCWLQQSHQAFETLSPHFPPPSQLSPPPTSPFLTLSLSRLVPYLSLPSRLATARFTICFYRPGSSGSSKMAAAELSSSCAQAAAAPTKVLGTRAPLTNDDRGIIASTCPVILHTLYTV